MSDKVAVTYTGDNVFESGIPARDLTPAEWGAVDAETQARLLAAGVYTLPAKKDGK